MSDLTEIQKLAMLANTPGREPNSQPTLKTLSIRLPYELLAKLDAFGAVSGITSRNTLMISLLTAAINDVVSEIIDEDKYEAALDHFREHYELIQEHEQE